MAGISFLGAGGAGDRLPGDLKPISGYNVRVNVFFIGYDQRGDRMILRSSVETHCTSAEGFDSFVKTCRSKVDEKRYVLRFRVEYDLWKRPLTLKLWSRIRDNYDILVVIIPKRGFRVTVVKMFFTQDTFHREETSTSCEDYDEFLRMCNANKRPIRENDKNRDRFECVGYSLYHNREEHELTDRIWDSIARGDMIKVFYCLSFNISVRKTFHEGNEEIEIQRLTMKILLTPDSFNEFIWSMDENNSLPSDSARRFEEMYLFIGEARKNVLECDNWGTLTEDDIIYVDYYEGPAHGNNDID
jgi:hypothetical protein